MCICNEVNKNSILLLQQMYFGHETNVKTVKNVNREIKYQINTGTHNES